jgi:hypothetical protein
MRAEPTCSRFGNRQDRDADAVVEPDSARGDRAAVQEDGGGSG